MWQAMNKYIYKNNRPQLTVSNSGGGQLGNCYSSSTYMVTSLHALSESDLRSLRDIGCMVYGQEFYVKQVDEAGKLLPVSVSLDWHGRSKVAPSGHDVVECVEVNYKGEVIACPGINPYSKEPYKPMRIPYYVYQCESRVDSSD